MTISAISVKTLLASKGASCLPPHTNVTSATISHSRPPLLLGGTNYQPTEFPATLLHQLPTARPRRLMPLLQKDHSQQRNPRKRIKLQIVSRNPRATKLATKTKSPKVPSPLPSGASKNFAAALHLNMTYLQSCLPPGSLNLYQPRRYGNRLGVPCVCQQCGDRPPNYIRPWNRWRWMNFHMFVRHTLKQVPMVTD